MSSPHALFEITCRTVQGRFLLKPSRRLNELIHGVIGRAQAQHPYVNLYLFVVMSNHMHLILSAPDWKTLSAFMNFINANIAKEAGRLYGWREKFWGRRFVSIEVLDEEKLMERVHYLLSHGCKEGMVKRPGEWMGVNCVKALTTGRPLSGVWIDRTAFWNAGKNKGDLSKYEKKYEVRLAMLPGFAGFSSKEQRREWRRIVRGIEEEYERNQVKDPLKIAGHPHHRPDSIKKAPRPFCHATTQALRKLYREAYEFFVMAHRQAREQFLIGDPEAFDLFPPGCFLPPFVRPILDPG